MNAGTATGNKLENYTHLSFDSAQDDVTSSAQHSVTLRGVEVLSNIVAVCLTVMCRR